MCFILLGDVGGTNIRLYLIESDYDLKNFHCKLSRNYTQQTRVTINGQPQSVQTYNSLSQPLHDFLAEYSRIFQENISSKSESEQKIAMENPKYITYTKRSIGENGEVSETEEKYFRFWTGEPIEYKDPQSHLFRLFAAVAIAGNPVNNAIEKLANINWGRTDGNQIRKDFEFGCFYMLNDFHANGYGVLSMKRDDLTWVNRHVVTKAQKSDKKKKRKGKKGDAKPEKKYMSDLVKTQKELTLVIGMGTGLGVCGVMTKKKKSTAKSKDAKKPTSKINLYLDPESSQDTLKTQIDCGVFERDVLVMPSEGGHVGFPFFTSPDSFDLEFQKFVKKKKKVDFNYVSSELIYCGQGVPLLYQFINQLEGNGNESKPSGKEIFELAMQGDSVAKKTYEKFLEYLGVSVYTLSVMFVNKDRMVLSGPIVNSVYHKLYKKEKKKFWALLSKRLLAKGHFTEMLKKQRLFVFNDRDVICINVIFNYLYFNHIKPGH